MNNNSKRCDDRNESPASATDKPQTGDVQVKDVNGTRFSQVPKKLPVSGKKNSRTGEFREIAYNPWLQTSVATIRNSMDAAQRTLLDAGRRPLCGHFVHNSSRCLLIDVTSR